MIAMMLALALPTEVSAAGYVRDRDTWMALSPEAKIGYAEALSDSLNLIFADDTLAQALAKQGRLTCLISNKITGNALADIMTKAYSDNRFAQLAPSAVYIIKITAECHDYIDKARLAYGLGPQ
jgi:hypothetical protein